MRALQAVVLGASLGLVGGCDDVLGLEPLTGIDASAERDAALSSNDDAAGESAGEADAEGSSDAGAATEVDGCALDWIQATQGDVPPGAFGSSVPGSAVTLYVCRVADSGLGLIPGKLRPGYFCYFGDVGEPEQDYSDYEVLVPSNCTLAWSSAPAGVTPAGGVVSGHALDGGELFSCRLEDSGAMPGEIGHEGWSTNHECVYSYADASYATATDFDILAVQ